MMSLAGGVGLGAGGDFINVSPDSARFAGCRMDETVQWGPRTFRPGLEGWPYCADGEGN